MSHFGPPHPSSVTPSPDLASPLTSNLLPFSISSNSTRTNSAAFHLPQSTCLIKIAPVIYHFQTLQSLKSPSEAIKEMAIYPSPGAKPSLPNRSNQQPFNIEIWTEETTRAVNTLSLNPPVRSRLSPETLTIPLDESEASRQENDISARPPRRELVRRDSLKRREAFLKGNEGSRRRQRWENGSCREPFSRSQH